MTAVTVPQRMRLAQRNAAVGLYGLVSLTMRGGLAVLGIAAADDFHWSAALTAAFVAYATLVMRFGRVLVAPFMGSTSVRNVTQLSLLGIGLGYLLLSFAHSVAVAWIAVTLIGTGYGGAVLAIKVLMVGEQPSGVLRRLGLLATALNVGAAVGPLVSGLIQASYGADINFLQLGLLSIAGAALTSLLPSARTQVATTSARPTVRRLTDPEVSYPLLLLVFAFALYAQLYATVPLLVHARLDSGWVLGAVFVVNAVVVIALQVPASSLAARLDAVRRYGPAIGLVCFAASFAVLAYAHTGAVVLGAVAIASIAECLVLPIVEADLSALFGSGALVAAFTLSALAMGVGESIGSYLGVSLMLVGGSTASYFLLALACLSGLCAAVDTARAFLRSRSGAGVTVTHG
ncbi:MFS transporter [Micromonospora sp. DT4]|uniref:MFS transporter n=1 Tax=Micromonospora sp. DT4 TaxID=3393438 RepID=UPI003CECBA0A